MAAVMETFSVPASPSPSVEKTGRPKSSVVPAARSPSRQVNAVPVTSQSFGTSTPTLSALRPLVSTVTRTPFASTAPVVLSTWNLNGLALAASTPWASE